MRQLVQSLQRLLRCGAARRLQAHAFLHQFDQLLHSGKVKPGAVREASCTTNKKPKVVRGAEMAKMGQARGVEKSREAEAQVEAAWCGCKRCVAAVLAAGN